MSWPEGYPHEGGEGQEQRVVLVDDKIVTPIIVIAIVVRQSVWLSRLLHTTGLDVIHRWVIEDLLPLILC